MKGTNLRIAINELGGSEWTGGVTYRNNLVKSVQILVPEQKLFFVSSSPKKEKEMSSLIPVQAKSAGAIINAINRFTKKVISRDIVLENTIKQHRIDAIFPQSLACGSKTATVYWIPDFQFMHLPHLYSKVQLQHYDVKLKRYFKDAHRIVVSSQDAYDDFKTFSPEYLHKVRIMRFVAHVPQIIYESDPSIISNTYNIPSAFFYMPNQFWAHKNHMLVLEALALLKKKKIRSFIVCSGNPVDVRDPLYLAKFLQKMSELGLRDQIALLGLVPHDHVYWLIRQSKCVLNPSLFEGWSTSVEEAKSVGKRVLLSDLNVHKEQNPPKSIYFERNSAQSLADSMEKAWLEFLEGPDTEMEYAAKEQLEIRMKEFGRLFLEICSEAKESLK